MEFCSRSPVLQSVTWYRLFRTRLLPPFLPTLRRTATLCWSKSPFCISWPYITVPTVTKLPVCHKLSEIRRTKPVLAAGLAYIVCQLWSVVYSNILYCASQKRRTYLTDYTVSQCRCPQSIYAPLLWCFLRFRRLIEHLESCLWYINLGIITLLCFEW